MPQQDGRVRGEGLGVGRGLGEREGQALTRPDAFSVPAVHGVWEEWSPWSLCSFTCGRGHRTRTRMCAPPQHGGRACDGPETQTKLCNIALCPGIASSALNSHQPLGAGGRGLMMGRQVRSERRLNPLGLGLFRLAILIISQQSAAEVSKIN